MDSLEPISHVIWADNVYILAAGFGQFVEMFGELTTAIMDSRLEWKRKELKFLCVEGDFAPSKLECVVAGELIPSRVASAWRPWGKVWIAGVALGRRWSIASRRRRV